MTDKLKIILILITMKTNFHEEEADMNWKMANCIKISVRPRVAMDWRAANLDR